MRGRVLGSGCALLCALALHSATGAPQRGAEASARLDRLEAGITAAEAIRDIKKLQRAYGYYLDKGLWEDLADLFTADAVANYPAGVFIGQASIREHLYRNVGGGRMGQLGLGDGRLYNHMTLQPVVHLDPGGSTAHGRWRALATFGRYGGAAVWAEGVYEFEYAREGGVWKIRRLDYYSGFGAPYESGWAAPAPAAGAVRAPAAGAAPEPPAVAAPAPAAGAAAPRERARMALAYPPDRPRDHTCDGFPKACLAPFDYANLGGGAAARAWILTPAQIAAAAGDRSDASVRAAALAHRVELLSDGQQVENLQRIYGYYLDRGQWDQLADLFAEDGTIELDQRGVYVGRAHIRRFLDLLGPEGGRYGWLNDHLQLQPIVDVAPDGRTARARSRELAMTGEYGKWGRWSEGVYENTFVKQDGVWKIRSLHFYPTFITDYDQGWGRSAEPAPQPSTTVPPDRAPTEVYAIYPKAYVPPFHYPNPVTGRPPHYPPVGAPPAALGEAMLASAATAAPPPARDVAVTIEQAERLLQRVEDVDEIENLESGYGYYLDKNLWGELSALFAPQGTLELAQRGVYVGREHVHTFLLEGLGRGHEGPREGMLGNHLQLQPVIDVASDGRTARVRSRVLQQMAFGTRASLAAGVYENELVKIDGVWLLAKDHAFNTLAASYLGGWAHAANPHPPGPSTQLPPDAPPTVRFEMFPVVYPIPYHYANPVSGRVALAGGAGMSAVSQIPAGMPPAIAQALRAIGPRIEAQKTAALYAPLLPNEPYAGIDLVRDQHYGPHERNVLDLFSAAPGGSRQSRHSRGRPVLVFIHGGGFSRDSKHTPGSPFYDNVGVWAAAHGLLGVTMNYRLAPQFPFPSGIEDVTAAVAWLRTHAAEHGGDPDSVFLWGHSAGAAHVADYLAHLAQQGERAPIAGAILTSGFYELGHEVSVWKDYYGTDVTRYAERSSLPGLLKTATPLLVTDAELDPEMMREQSALLIERRAKEGRPVASVHLPAHSHLSETYAVGTADESLSAPVLAFVRAHAAH